MVPAKDAPGHIERMLIRDGHVTEFVQAALARHQSAPEGQRVELSRNVSAINWPTDKVKLELSRGQPVNDLVLVKIAFEFLALISGSVICNDTRQLNEIRGALRSQDPVSNAFKVERLLAPHYDTFHGIYFEGNDPYLKIQVRLFGKLAYRVHFYRLALNGAKIIYTHNLKSGDEEVRQQQNE
jgi:hypothetical protein